MEHLASGGAQKTGCNDLTRRRPVMVRVPERLLQRIDAAAKRLGLARSAFMLASTAEKLETMEGRTP